MISEQEARRSGEVMSDARAPKAVSALGHQRIIGLMPSATTRSEAVVLPSSRKPKRQTMAISFVVILALSLNLRPSITSLPPIFPELAARLSLSAGQITLLATLPVLLFAVSSLAMPAIRMRIGEDRLVTGSLSLLAISLLARGLFPGVLLLGTALAAAAIGFIGALIPSLASRYNPRSAGAMLGLYLVGLYGGAILGGATSVPIYINTNKSLVIALGVWSFLAILTLPIWIYSLAKMKTEQSHISVGWLWGGMAACVPVTMPACGGGGVCRDICL
jgi:cyanate permease